MSLVSDLRNLDRNNIGGWPKSVKTFFIVGIIVVILLLGWYFYISGKQDTLATAQRREVALKHQFETKHAKAVNLEALKAQLAQMNEMLSQMLRQLPSKTEMPALLVNISQTAQAAGIHTQLFQPEHEIPKKFYAIVPIKLKMQGTYHQFGTFISGVASLPHVVILTMHNVSLRRVGGGKTGPPAGGQLSLEGTVETYRYIGDDASSKPVKHKRKKRK